MPSIISPDSTALAGEAQASYRRLRQQTLQDLRQELQHKNRRFALQRDARLRREKERMQFLADSGVSLRRIEEEERRDAQELEEILAKDRTQVIDPAPHRPAEIRSREDREFLISQMGNPVELAGMDVLTGLRTGAEPEFSATYQRDLKSTMSGSGWGCGVKENPDYPDTMAYWWHVFTPAQARTFTFYISAPYSGFYVTRADDSWYNCKYVKTYCFYDMDVYQLSWRGMERRTVLDRRGSNVNDTGRMQGTTVWSFNHALQAGIPVTVRVRITLDIYAQGGGSYGELNFADGSANYLESPEVYIY